MGLPALTFLPLLLAQQPPPAVPVLQPEVVLAEDIDPVPLASFGLGAGGIDDRHAPDRLRWSENGCTTARGVRVECRPVGVKLNFPSGRELLFAVDGTLHLRSGEKAGPFPFGAELRLGDGASVRVVLAQNDRDRLREVTVVEGDKNAQPWARGVAARNIEDPKMWGGVRICCCGDGGELFRAVALGPLVVLDRLLVPKEREGEVPRERLVVLTATLLQSMAAMPKLHAAPDPALHRAVTAVAATADRGSVVFPAGASLQRAEQHQLRWVLRSGYELELALTGQNAPRLALFAGRSPKPMVEWTLMGAPAAFLPNPNGDEPGAGRWHGNGLHLRRIAADLQARAELHEAAYALQVIGRLPK